MKKRTKKERNCTPVDATKLNCEFSSVQFISVTVYTPLKHQCKRTHATDATDKRLTVSDALRCSYSLSASPCVCCSSKHQRTHHNILAASHFHVFVLHSAALMLMF